MIRWILIIVFAVFNCVGLLFLLGGSRHRTRGEIGAKSLKRAKEMLAMRAIETGRPINPKAVYFLLCLSFLLLIAGIAIPVVMAGNVPVALVIGPVSAQVPWIVLDYIGRKTRKTMQGHMEHAMGLVTNSYLRGQDIIKAIVDNVGEFSGYTEVLFKEFLTEISLTDSSVSSSILHMRDKSTDTYFYQWCTVLLQCVEDREMRFMLPSIVVEMADSKGAIREAETSIKKAQRDFVVILIIALMQFPMVKQINYGWYIMLSRTTAVAFAVITICALMVVKMGWDAQGGKRK